MATYTSGIIHVESGITYATETTPNDSYVSSAYIQFQGISDFTYGDSGEWDRDFGVFSLPSTRTCNIDDFCPATEFVSGYLSYGFWTFDTAADITVKLIDSDGESVLDTNFYDDTTGDSGSFTMYATYINTTKYVSFTKDGSSPFMGSLTGHAVYYYEEETLKTGTPVVTCNGNNVTYAGELSDGEWTSWLVCPTGFILGDGAVNTMTFNIQGTEEANFRYKYNYTLPSTIEGWVVYGDTDDYTSYEVFPGGYATTLMSGTWPTITGLDYGAGSLVLEFKENVGETSPVATLNVEDDFITFDYDFEVERVGSVIQSRGTKLVGGTIYSIYSDWATTLSLSATVDTFLIANVESNTSSLWVMTQLPTTDTATYIIAPNTQNMEYATIIASGVDSTGQWYKMSATLQHDHGMFEEVLAAGNAKWVFEGTSADITSWYNTMVSQYGAPETTILDPYWPLRIGSEVIYMYSMPSSTSTSLTFRSATEPHRGEYGVGCAHNAGVLAFCVPTLGLYPIATSIYSEYGPAEVYISPLSVVDGNTLDDLTRNCFMNSTTSATSAMGTISIFEMPATLKVGDWIYLEEVW